jgi:REP element-mobilizing transposase RayT
MPDTRPERGWHSRGYLPHLDAAETIQFITFRLADSLPAHVARGLLDDGRAHSKFEALLDAGHGDCWLAKHEIASVVEDALLHFDGTRYRVLAWCVMPNHVHVVIETMAGHGLSDVVRSWKTFTAVTANRRLGRSGTFWHRDYFDRYMRDEKHLEVTLDYVERNPVQAGLASAPQGWRWSSAWRREREYWR